MHLQDTAFEIHMYLGQGHTIDIPEYPVGENHGFILYLRQDKGSEYQWSRAEEIINEMGIDQVDLSKAGRLDPSRINDNHSDFYESALKKGFSIVIYSDPI